MPEPSSPTTPDHLRPWSVVDDEELRLLRELERAVSGEASRVSSHTYRILGRLHAVRTRKG